jgi:hypothetical protein
MYMAKVNTNGRIRYCLRYSYKTRLGYFSRDLFDLGEDPSRYLVYPGGNAFYVDEQVEEKLTEAVSRYQDHGATSVVDSDALEALFWPFVRPDIRRAVETFQSRGRAGDHGANGGLSEDEQHTIRYGMPRFDKRRLHYLKFGHMDQGAVENMPDIIFRPLLRKSRDEIEQYFLSQERRLNHFELKTYLYAALDIQRFFQSFMAKRMPHVLDQEAVDTHFIETLCLINHTLFHEGLFDYGIAAQRQPSRRSSLHPYLRRYVILFFDHDYADSSLLNDFARRFMNAHRSHTAPPPKKRVREDKALKIMELSKSEFQEMTQRTLTRHYRKLAGKHHPDRGGAHESFVALNDAYESLLERL